MDVLIAQLEVAAPRPRSGGGGGGGRARAMGWTIREVGG